MNIHKFNSKPKTTPPKTIQWRLLREVKYPARKVNPLKFLVSKKLISIRGKLHKYD